MALPRYYGRSDSCSPGSSASSGMNTVSIGQQVSLVHTARPFMHSVTKHLTRPATASPLPAQRGRLPGLYPDLDFTLNPQARRYARPNRVRPSYGLHVRLRLLSTPPRGDAVTFGYRERASPGEGAFTSQIAPAPRRTVSRFRENDENRAKKLLRFYHFCFLHTTIRTKRGRKNEKSI